MKKVLVSIFCGFLSIIFCGIGGDGLDKKLDNFDCDYEVVEYYENGGLFVKIQCDNIEEFLSNIGVETVSRKLIAGREIIEGYCSSLDNYIINNGRKINLQISLSDEVLIGYPLIKNSFWK